MKKLLSLILLISLLTFSAFAAHQTGSIYIAEKGGTLHLRETPSTSSESLGFVKHGEEISIIREYGEWTNIYVPRLDAYGYLKTKYIVQTKPDIMKIVPFDTCLDLPGTFLIDVNGDGIKDTVDVVSRFDPYSFEIFTLKIDLSDGTRLEREFMFSFFPTIVFTTFSSSDRVYILVSGDIMSSDFVTECLYVENGAFKNIPFADCEPFSADISFPGAVYSMQDGILVLDSTLDTLGTRSYTGEFVLSNGVLVPNDRFIWKSLYSVNDSDTWEYCSLTTVRDIEAVIFERPSVLKAASQIILTAIDETECKAYFVSAQGECGYLTYEKSVSDTEWGVRINGVHEDLLFESIPYAG